MYPLSATRVLLIMRVYLCYLFMVIKKQNTKVSENFICRYSKTSEIPMLDSTFQRIEIWNKL